MHTLRDWKRKVYKTGDRTKFYQTPEWKETRRQVLFDANYHCLRCDNRFRSEQLTAHHLVPRSEGGSDFPPNIVCMCNKCHDFVEIAGLRTKVDIVGSYEGVVSTDSQGDKPATERIETFERPEWHKWVYGGVKRKR